ARDGAEATDGARTGRVGLDRDESAGEGPQSPLRDGHGVGHGLAALPGGRTGTGVSPFGVVPLPQVLPAEQGGADDDGTGGRRAGARGGGAGNEHGSDLPRAAGDEKRTRGRDSGQG